MASFDAVVDTGPLVPYFNRPEANHAWARQQMARPSAPLFTCELVLSEVLHLLDGAEQGIESFVEFLERDTVRVPSSYPDHVDRLNNLLLAYADQSMSLVDACLVCMAEDESASELVTTDRDFHVYRMSADEPLDVILPD